MAQGMDRRRFLKMAGAGALAGPLLAAGCAAQGKRGHRPAPSERVVMGAIGLGWQGPENLGKFLSNKDVQVVAICDVDRNHLAAVKETVDRTYGNTDCVVYMNFEELLARRDLDAVSIAVPDHWHAIPAIAAANAGLDIYGEKPLSHTLAEGRAMVKAVAKNKRIWQTGSWQRSVANFHHAAELVRNGRIGKVKYCEVGLDAGYDDYAHTKDLTAYCAPPPELDYDRWLGPAPDHPYCPARLHKNWRWVMAYGGGRIMDWVGHHLDIAHWGLGLDRTGPISVEGTGCIPAPGSVWDAPTEYDCVATYEDGLQIRLCSKFETGTKWYGEHGWLYVDRGELKAEHESVLKETIGENEIHLYKCRDHFRNFVECVKTRKETITPAEVAHRSASVGHLCNIALYTGRKIRWNPKTEEILDDAAATAMLSPNYRAPWKL